MHLAPTAPNDILIELHVPDFQPVKDFYPKLGFEVLWEYPPTTDVGYLVIKRGTSTLAFYGGNEKVYQHSYFQKFPTDTPRGYAVELAIYIQDQPIDAFYQQVLQTLGSDCVVDQLILQPWNKKDFRIVDPFGFYLRFSEPDNILIP